MIVDIILIILFLVSVYRASKSDTFFFASFIYVVFFVIYIYIGTIMMYYDPYIDNDVHLEKMVLLVRAGFGAILFAFYVSRVFLKRESIYNKVVEPLDTSKTHAFYFASIIIVLISTLYLFIIPINPLLVMIADPASLVTARFQATTDLRNFGFFSNFLYYYLPIVWLVFIFLGNKKIALTLFVFNCILVLSTGQKAPVIYNIILLYLSYGLFNKSINIKKTVFIIALMISILLLMVIAQNWHALIAADGGVLELAWAGLRRRIFYGGTLSLLHYVEYFPQYFGHYYFSPPAVPPDQLVYQFINPGAEVVGTDNTNSIGNFYAAYGNVFLVFIAMMGLSLAVFIIDVKIFNHMKTAFGFAFYILYCLTVIKLSIADWYTILPFYIGVCFSFLGCVYMSSVILKGIVYNNCIIRHVSVPVFFLSLFYFLYYFQGQVRGLISG